MDFRRLTLASIAIGALGLASSATWVQPAETAGKPSGHCVMNLSKPGAPTICYDTFTASIAAATGGRITDAPADGRVAMNDQRLLAQLNASGDEKSAAAVPPGADVLMAVFFADGSFGGPSLSYVGPGCTATLHDIDAAVPYVGDAWKDGLQAFVAFNNCHVRLWQHRDFQGAMLDWARSRSDFGKLTDDVGSFQFS